MSEIDEKLEGQGLSDAELEEVVGGQNSARFTNSAGFSNSALITDSALTAGNAVARRVVGIAMCPKCNSTHVVLDSKGRVVYCNKCGRSFSRSH